jgi:hypothetical protein
MANVHGQFALNQLVRIKPKVQNTIDSNLLEVRKTPKKTPSQT